jgi:hypothetical protein
VVTFTHDVINFGPGTVTNLDVYLALPKERSTQESGHRLSAAPGRRLTDPGASRSPARPARAQAGEAPPRACGPRPHLRRCTTSSRRRWDAEDIRRHPRPLPPTTQVPAWTGHPDAVRGGRQAGQSLLIARDIYTTSTGKCSTSASAADIAPTVLQRGSGHARYTFVYIAMPRRRPARYVARSWCGEDAFDFVYHRCRGLPARRLEPSDGGDQESRATGHALRPPEPLFRPPRAAAARVPEVGLQLPETGADAAFAAPEMIATGAAVGCAVETGYSAPRAASSRSPRLRMWCPIAEAARGQAVQP